MILHTPAMIAAGPTGARWVLRAEVLALLETLQWAAEDVNDAHGAEFCPSCGAHSPECPCEWCERGAEEMGDEPDRGHHPTCELERALLSLRPKVRARLSSREDTTPRKG